MGRSRKEENGREYSGSLRGAEAPVTLLCVYKSLQPALVFAGGLPEATELPARGKSCPPSHSLEGQVLVVQAEDLLQARKLILDLATWLQCFALYAAVLAPTQPERVPELMAYQVTIAKASMK